MCAPQDLDLPITEGNAIRTASLRSAQLLSCFCLIKCTSVHSAWYRWIGLHCFHKDMVSVMFVYDTKEGCSSCKVRSLNVALCLSWMGLVLMECGSSSRVSLFEGSTLTVLCYCGVARNNFSCSLLFLLIPQNVLNSLRWLLRRSYKLWACN